MTHPTCSSGAAAWSSFALTNTSKAPAADLDAHLGPAVRTVPSPRPPLGADGGRGLLRRRF
jgi:hypothetical protein